MDSEILKKSRKKIFLILIINIFCIIMISFFPWIQVTENNIVKNSVNFLIHMLRIFIIQKKTNLICGNGKTGICWLGLGIEMWGANFHLMCYT